MRISEVLKAKSSPEVLTISPDATVRELVSSLARHNIGALLVSADGASVDGIVSERDIVRRLNEAPDLLDHAVSSIMTSEVRTCEPDANLDDLRAQMTEHRIRHVPVMSEGRLVGIVSIGDVVKHSMQQLQFERDQLDSNVHRI